MTFLFISLGFQTAARCQQPNTQMIIWRWRELDVSKIHGSSARQKYWFLRESSAVWSQEHCATLTILEHYRRIQPLTNARLWQRSNITQTLPQWSRSGKQTFTAPRVTRRRYNRNTVFFLLPTIFYTKYFLQASRCVSGWQPGDRNNLHSARSDDSHLVHIHTRFMFICHFVTGNSLCIKRWLRGATLRVNNKTLLNGNTWACSQDCHNRQKVSSFQYSLWAQLVASFSTAGVMIRFATSLVIKWFPVRSRSSLIILEIKRCLPKNVSMTIT